MILKPHPLRHFPPCQMYPDRGRVSNHQKGINQQYLTPAEESVLVGYFLRMSSNGYPLPVKFAGSLAHVIALH